MDAAAAVRMIEGLKIRSIFITPPGAKADGTVYLNLGREAGSVVASAKLTPEEAMEWGASLIKWGAIEQERKAAG